MHAYDNSLHLQHFAGVLQDEADPGETHDEEHRRQDASHYRPWEGQGGEFLK